MDERFGQYLRGDLLYVPNDTNRGRGKLIVRFRAVSSVLAEFAIAPECQGQGLGTQLMLRVWVNAEKEGLNVALTPHPGKLLRSTGGSELTPSKRCDSAQGNLTSMQRRYRYGMGIR
jgi:GNAT superfamily N-acetyltransferase